LPPSTILKEAVSLYNDLIQRNPQGLTMERSLFDRLIMLGYGKAKTQADNITRTGVGLRFWQTTYNYQTRVGHVVIMAGAVLPESATVGGRSPGLQASPVVQGSPQALGQLGVGGRVP